MPETFTTEQLRDIQGLGLAGFKKDHQELLFIRFGNATGGRQLLDWLAPRAANAWEVDTFNQVFSEIRHRVGEGSVKATWIGVLISNLGYQALGVATSALPATTGTAAFTAGMANRSLQIGDTDPLDSPANWLTPFQPNEGVHLCVVVAADDDADLDEAVVAVCNQVSATGCQVVFQELGKTLPPPLKGREHFGFKDGISQPAITGYNPPPAPNEPPPVAAGELVLGFPDNAGNTAVPQGTLWANGSFVVFRRLIQNVEAFRQLVATGVPGSNPPLTPAQTAAALVGRWPSGAPLELNPASDPGPSKISNAFQYKNASPTDDDGHVCPHFAHIRKTNPRDETTPSPSTDDPQLHRMLRRGLPFGSPLPPDATADDGQQRGLHFISVVADLDQQFEFVQRQWVNDPNFPNGTPPPSPGPYGPPAQGQQPDGPDPIAAEGDTGSPVLLVQAAGNTTFPIPAQLQNVTAGEYFFLPSLTAIGNIANGATQ